MSLLDRYRAMFTPGKSIAPFYELMAERLDALEAILAPLRTPEKLPVYDSPIAEKSFLWRLRACNGNGDIQNWLRDAAAAIDRMEEALSRLPDTAEEAAPRPSPAAAPSAADEEHAMRLPPEAEPASAPPATAAEMLRKGSWPNGRPRKLA